MLTVKTFKLTCKTEDDVTQILQCDLNIKTQKNSHHLLLLFFELVLFLQIEVTKWHVLVKFLNAFKLMNTNFINKPIIISLILYFHVNML